MEIFYKFSFPYILYLLTMVFGFWLSNAGKPYNGILFNTHKLIALGAVVLAIFQFSRTPMGANSLVLIGALLILAALCVIALFASGALMSAGKMDHALMRTIHRIGLVLLTICLASVAYLL